MLALLIERRLPDVNWEGLTFVGGPTRGGRQQCSDENHDREGRQRHRAAYADTAQQAMGELVSNFLLIVIAASVAKPPPVTSMGIVLK